MSHHTDKLREQILHAHNHGPSDETVLVLEMIEVIMGAIEDIQAEFTDYKGSVTQVFAAIDAALGDFETRINDLTTELQNAGVDPAKAAALSADIAAARQTASDELSKVQTADPGAPAPVASGGTDSGGGQPTGGSAVPNYYTFDGDPTTVNTTVWPASGLQTDDPAINPAKPLFTFANDTAGQPPAGDGADGNQWHVYTGATAPVPAT